MPMMAALAFLFGCFFKTGGADGTDKIGGGLRGFAVLAGGFLAASVFLVRAPSGQYLLMAAPFVSMVAAFSLRRLFTDSAAKMVLTAFALLCASYWILKMGDGGQKEHAMSHYQYALSVSDPKDVFLGYRSNLFRKDADFFWFCVEPKECLDTYRSFRDYAYDPVQIITEVRPKVVRLPGKRGGFYDSIKKHLELSPDYERSPRYSILYIRNEGR